MTLVSRETDNLLRDYAALIRKWNPAINLIAPQSLDCLEDRHIGDSQQLALVSTAANGSWADLGSGGGLPGLVQAIMRPDLDLTLLESDQRKATFLRTVARELHLPNVNVRSERIEKADQLDVANVSARALAPLPLLMSYVFRHLRADGTAWLMKGKNWKTEVDEARQMWNFNMIAHPSSTESGAAILQITDIRHV